MYMGAAGVVNFGGARIAGLTGIYKSHDYTCGHFEMPPYDNRTVRSAYHVRDLEVYRLMKVRFVTTSLYLLAISVLINTHWTVC